jgi:hypothetical protein
VVEFARNKPEQFQLGQMSEGIRVCQFYTKQCRVQISEEDYVLISSGIPQKMIPPQPIIEDEEKELGTIDILEKNLGQICQLADQGERNTPLGCRIEAFLSTEAWHRQHNMARLLLSTGTLTMYSCCSNPPAQPQTQGSQTGHPRSPRYRKPCPTHSPARESLQCRPYERRHLKCCRARTCTSTWSGPRSASTNLPQRRWFCCS